MREIKFRAWDKKNKEMVFLTLLGLQSRLFSDLTVYGVNNKDGDVAHSKEDDVPIMQYTGLKDKNGVEIYEGDILQIEQDEGIDDFPNWVKHKEVVSFSQGSFISIFDYAIGELFAMEYEPEIIGNIYENKELLK